MIEDQLSDKITLCIKTNELTIVSICGASDLGKSYLSKKISESLTRRNLRTNHLTMDSYLMDREVRKERGSNGYNIEAYNQKEALKNLIALKNGESMDFKPYNHNLGK